MSNKIKIGIHGIPRSGTSWLGQIINSSPNVIYKFQPLFSYELKGFLNEKSSAEEINGFFNALETTSSDFLNQAEGIKKGIVPVFKKNNPTHIAYKEVRYHHVLDNMLAKVPDIKAIGIIRNPLSAINSWLNSPKEFRKDLGWVEKEEWRYAKLKNQNKPEEFYGFEKWKEVAEMFEILSKQYESRFYLLKYDSLLTEPQEEVKNIFEFCELEMTYQTEEFVKLSRGSNKKDTYSVFNSKSSDDERANSLDAEIAEEIINDLKGTALEKYI